MVLSDDTHYGVLPNYIGNRRAEVRSETEYPVFNPAFGKIIGYAPDTPKEEVDFCAESAASAQEKWCRIPVTERIKVLFRLQQLLVDRTDELAATLTREHGKTFEEARAELGRAIENIEAAASAVYHMMGKNNLEISLGIDEELYRVPIGVFAAITPFNFPLMVPFWFIPYAVALGNSIIVKPSEKTPVSMSVVAELFQKAGFPENVVTVVNGGPKTVDALLDNKLISGYSFVGSTPVADYVFKRAALGHKRVQAGASAKNFELVMPDADPSLVIHSLISSFFGNAGQRCLAGSVLVTLLENHCSVVKAFTDAASRLKLGYGLEKGVDMGPLIRGDHLERVKSYIDLGLDEGAKLLLDGRLKKPLDYPEGFFLGPSIFDEVTPDMRICKEEIFGPVASVVTAKNFDDALDIINSSKYGNASTIFTSNGVHAREFIKGVNTGNIGVNVGVAAPIAFYPFGGLKDSFFGDLHAQGGEDHALFFTERKVVVSRWK
jgi:malonate-semialdehyde dehydrogenase (acetylating)/methylmalonate-semialdehyde dehydrogenase